MTAAEAGRRIVLWRGTDAWRAETAWVELRHDGLLATGRQIGSDPLLYELDYRLDASDGFVTRAFDVEARGQGWRRSVRLRHDGAGAWTCEATSAGDLDLPAAGGPVDELRDARDCDLGFSPLTNAMPVQRHELHRRPGSVDLLMVWVSVPDLAVFASAQRYEHVRRTASGAAVRFVDRGRFAGFQAELEFDAAGLVLRYPDLAKRLDDGPAPP